MSYRREQKLQGRQFDTTQTPFSHHFSCISLKALKNTNTKKISHSDCICPAGASTWDDAVYLNLSTLQVRSIGWHTWGGDLRGPTVFLWSGASLSQHSHPLWVSVQQLYSSVCFHPIKLFNVTSKHNSLCILRLKWNTLCGWKASVLLRFYLHNKTLHDGLYGSTCREEGRLTSGGEPVIPQTWSLFTSTRPHSTGVLWEICLSDVLPRGVEEKIWQRTFLQRLMSRPTLCLFSSYV